MTVMELLEILQTEDPNRVVVIAKDASGNAYSPMADYRLGTYVPETTWTGDMYVERVDGKPPDGYDEEDCYDGADGQAALVLEPVN